MPRLVALQWLGALVVVLPMVQEQEDTGVSLGVLALLVIVGLGLVVAEVFFVSFGILSMLSAVALISAVFLAFQKGQFFGFVFLTIAAIGAPVTVYWALKWLPNTPVGRMLMLAGPSREAVTRTAEEPGLHGFLHKPGVALSPLRPAGYARIDGQRVDVVTRGEMLDSGCSLQVVEVEGNRVVVAELGEDGVEKPAAGTQVNLEKPDQQQG